jgi:hypothetical protein
MGLIVCSAFGTLQTSIGYVDVYPFAVVVTALFFWTALRALLRGGHVAWPIAIAALGPFVYLGLVLLAPSAAVLLLLTLRRPGGPRRALAAVAAGALVAGAATLPLDGRPFDWFWFARRAWAGRAHRAGLLPDSSLLPGWYVWSARHAGEVASTLGLIDPVGCLLLATAGVALLAWAPRRSLDAPSLVLAAFVGGFLSYLWVMDATFGAFADWDLFSYGAVATSLLGAYAFIRVGRECPRRFGFLLGLALALAVVHLLARLNALDVEAERHLAESPIHKLAPLAYPPSPP